MSAYREDGLKLHNEERRRREQRKARWLVSEARVSEAPAELWVRPRTVRDPDGPVLPGQGWYQTLLRDEPDAVRYIRADVYEALLARMAVVRSWGEAPCLEPLGTDYPR